LSNAVETTNKPPDEIHKEDSCLKR